MVSSGVGGGNVVVGVYSSGIYHNIGNIRGSTGSEFIFNCIGSHCSIGCFVGPIKRRIKFMVNNGTELVLILYKRLLLQVQSRPFLNLNIVIFYRVQLYSIYKLLRSSSVDASLSKFVNLAILVWRMLPEH